MKRTIYLLKFRLTEAIHMAKIIEGAYQAGVNEEDYTVQVIED